MRFRNPLGQCTKFRNCRRVKQLTPRRSLTMTSTFLHEDKTIPADELVDADAPTCESCDQRMWLCRVETKVRAEGTISRKEYECKICGESRSVLSRRTLQLT